MANMTIEQDLLPLALVAMEKEAKYKLYLHNDKTKELIRKRLGWKAWRMCKVVGDTVYVGAYQFTNKKEDSVYYEFWDLYLIDTGGKRYAIESLAHLGEHFKKKHGMKE